MNWRLHRCNLLLHMQQKFVVTGSWFGYAQCAEFFREISPRSFLAGREGKTLSAFFMPNTIGRRPAATGSLRGYARVRKSNRRSLKLFDGLFHHRIGGGMDELRGP